MKPCTLKTNSLLSYISHFLAGKGWKNIKNNLHSDGLYLLQNIGVHLFNEGVDCEVLTPGKNWQKGKVKITISLEFQSDEPEIEVIPENSNSESSLDDIRRKLNQTN